MNDNRLGKWPIVCDAIPVQWGDMDAFAHVNNTLYLRWFETARIAYFRAVAGEEKLQFVRPGGVGPILASATVNFRLPLEYPDVIKVAATVSKIGDTSFEMKYEVRSQKFDDAVAADGVAVMVSFDYAAGKPVRVEDALREGIYALEATA